MAGREVLIVEDDEAIAAGLALNLQVEGYEPIRVTDGEAALERIHAAEPALILLDIALPKKSGLDVLSELRATGRSTPVIVLSARQDEYDKVAALRLGADDYVTKPFALAELLARCAAVLRRASPQRPVVPAGASVVDFGSVTVDLERRRAWSGDREVPFTHLELELLAYFVGNPGRVVSREHLLFEVWGASAGSPRTVDNFVAQLRAKLERDPDRSRHFVTVRGSGYRFDP
jgi:two-component system, OmpR family, alkaline phosphatase synthesis response regulator PhoP